MAAEPEQDNQEATAKPKKVWLMAGIGGGVLVIVVVLGLFLMLRGGDDSVSAVQPERSEAIETNVGEALYVAMPRDLIFNVPGERRDRVAQVGIQMLVRGPRNEVLAQENIPLLEATFLDIFARVTAERLNTPEGKREIRLQALDAVRAKMREATDGSPVVEEVLFTNFVMQ